MNNNQTTVRQQAKHTSSSGSGHQLSSRGATRAQHHETAGCHRPRRHILEDPKKELAKARPAAHAKSAAHRSRQASSTRVRKMEGSERALALARSRTKVHVSPDLPLRQPRRPIWTWCGVRRVQDKCVPSDAERSATPRRRCGRRLGEQCRHSGEGSPAPKQWETFGDNFQPSAIECLWGQQGLEPSRLWKPGRLPRGTLWPLHSPQQIPF